MDDENKIGNESTQFQPGQSGNPAGRPPMPKELREARKMSKAKFGEAIEKFMHLSNNQLKELLKDNENVTQYEQIILRFIVESKKRGAKTDYFKTLLDRWIGKVAETHNHNFGGSNFKLMIERIESGEDQ